MPECQMTQGSGQSVVVDLVKKIFHGPFCVLSIPKDLESRRQGVKPVSKLAYVGVVFKSNTKRGQAWLKVKDLANKGGLLVATCADACLVRYARTVTAQSIFAERKESSPGMMTRVSDRSLPSICLSPCWTGSASIMLNWRHKSVRNG